ncbi:MAG: hypothetical protein P4L53_23835 [Candidatus Obscuribacterales bacterium]|nr:hypothetical protein [Candidatus Obscuribacterales bacterium]
MTRNVRKSNSRRASSSQAAESAKSHLEIEVKVALKNKAEVKSVMKWLYGHGYNFEKTTRIVDFVEPSKSVTSRVRFEKTLDAREKVVSTSISCDPIDCYTGKKCHPITGELEDFVRQETEPSVTPEFALDMLMRAIEANNGDPIPYYTKKRRYFAGPVGKHRASIALDNPKGLKKKFSRRFMEVEIQRPLNSTKAQVAAVVDAINAFILRVLGEQRASEISYRKMVKETWEDRGMLKRGLSKS